jgi:hypothetical protein
VIRAGTTRLRTPGGRGRSRTRGHGSTTVTTYG